MNHFAGEGVGFPGWLDNVSDWLSPIVVKEVRQMVRGREFNYSFSLSLVTGLIVAVLGSGEALNGMGAGATIFSRLTSCLALIGLAVVPLGTFNMLRNERADQTLDLITLALSPRRVVIGKLLAQGVKLMTLFAGVAPFIAMSFLLGGIDFVTILISLAGLFMWSLWACAACLCLSSVFKSRMISGALFGGVCIFFLLTFSQVSIFVPGLMYGVRYVGISGPGVSSSYGWVLAITTTFCLTSMLNLVLLAENRLSPATEDRTTALRVGFLIQFLLIVACAVAPAFIYPLPTFSSWDAVNVLGLIGGLSLAVVAIFTVTEDLHVSRRVLRQNKAATEWRSLLWMFRPGGGRGAAYVLAQMAVLLVTGRLLTPESDANRRWLLAICGHICFFTGVPACLGRLLAPARAKAAYLRVGVFLFFPIAMLLADILYYLLTPSRVYAGDYSVYHVLNPFRTLANWPIVENGGTYFYVPMMVMGLIGLVAYLALIQLGRRSENENAVTSH